MSAEEPYGRFRALRPEYIALANGNACGALLIDLFAYWTQVRASNSEQARSGKKDGNDLWFYRTLADIRTDLYEAFGKAALRTALADLEKAGLIESRTNPSSPWDRTLQYRLTSKCQIRTLHDAESDFVQDAESDDDAGARPSQPSAAQAVIQTAEKKEEKNAPREGIQRRVDDEQRLVVIDLFEHWQRRCSKPTSKPTRERLEKVKARLREGYTVEQIRTAIDGAACGAFVNENGKRFDDLELICRTGSKLESFIDRAAPPPVANGGNVHPIRAANRNGKPTHSELISELRATNPRLQAQQAALTERT